MLDPDWDKNYSKMVLYSLAISHPDTRKSARESATNGDIDTFRKIATDAFSGAVPRQGSPNLAIPFVVQGIPEIVDWAWIAKEFLSKPDVKTPFDPQPE